MRLGIGGGGRLLRGGIKVGRGGVGWGVGVGPFSVTGGTRGRRRSSGGTRSAGYRATGGGGYSGRSAVTEVYAAPSQPTFPRWARSRELFVRRMAWCGAGFIGFLAAMWFCAGAFDSSPEASGLWGLGALLAGFAWLSWAALAIYSWSKRKGFRARGGIETEWDRESDRVALLSKRKTLGFSDRDLSTAKQRIALLRKGRLTLSQFQELGGHPEVLVRDGRLTRDEYLRRGGDPRLLDRNPLGAHQSGQATAALQRWTTEPQNFDGLLSAASPQTRELGRLLDGLAQERGWRMKVAKKSKGYYLASGTYLLRFYPGYSNPYGPDLGRIGLDIGRLRDLDLTKEVRRLRAHLNAMRGKPVSSREPELNSGAVVAHWGRFTQEFIPAYEQALEQYYREGGTSGG